MTRIIAIASGKGGVGRTTTTINLGCALTHFGNDTVLVDGNLDTPHIGLHLGSTHLPSTLNDALSGKKLITETAYLHPSGLKVIPASISMHDYKKSNLRNLRKALLDLIGTTKTVLLDIGSGTHEETVTALKAADEVLIVTTPDLLAISDAIKTVCISEETGKPVIGVILNKVSEHSELTEANVEALLGKKILATIPEDPSVKYSLALKQPLIISHPDSPAAVGFKKLAAVLLGQTYEPTVIKPKEPSPLDQLRQKLGL